MQEPQTQSQCLRNDHVEEPSDIWISVIERLLTMGKKLYRNDGDSGTEGQGDRCIHACGLASNTKEARCRQECEHHSPDRGDDDTPCLTEHRVGENHIPRVLQESRWAYRCLTGRLFREILVCPQLSMHCFHHRVLPRIMRTLQISAELCDGNNA